MEREIDLNQISDGKLYTANDMVKVSCGDCRGCSLCCHGMGNSIILDPYDLFQLEKGLNTDFDELMKEKMELNVVDGIIQPNLKMQENGDCCPFLSAEGRCAIHSFRPGYCRMFPLGRIYEEGDFRYFLQIHECPYPAKTKIKLKKWLGIPELSRYEAYIKRWHFFLKKAQKAIRETDNDDVVRNLNLYFLKQFYIKPYGDAFFEEFEARILEAESVI